MSRTIHHLSYRQARHHYWDCADCHRHYLIITGSRTYPYRHHDGQTCQRTIRGLRYTTGELTRAAQEGRRPAPQRIVLHNHRMEWTFFPPMGWHCLQFENAARQQARIRLQALRGLLRAGTDLDDLPAVEPYRPRSRAKWNAS